MNLFGEDDVRVERIWCGETIGTKLRVEHVLSGMSVEQVIGFEDETVRRRELIAELKEQVLAKYPPSESVMEVFYLGPGKGESLRLTHRPTGISVGGVVGHEKRHQHEREMWREMFAKLRKGTK